MHMDMIDSIEDYIIEGITEAECKMISNCLEPIGIEVDWKTESKRLFKNLAFEMDSSGSKNWYYNDGSIHGLLVCTITNVYDFSPEVVSWNEELVKFSIQTKCINHIKKNV